MGPGAIVLVLRVGTLIHFEGITITIRIRIPVASWIFQLDKGIGSNIGLEAIRESVTIRIDPIVTLGVRVGKVYLCCGNSLPIYVHAPDVNIGIL